MLMRDGEARNGVGSCRIVVGNLRERGVGGRRGGARLVVDADEGGSGMKVGAGVRGSWKRLCDPWLLPRGGG